MSRNYIQYIVFLAPFGSFGWKKIPRPAVVKKEVYKTPSRSYNAAPFPEGEAGDEGARRRDFDSLGLSPAPITEEQSGANPCRLGATFRKISGIRSVFSRIEMRFGPNRPLPIVYSAAP